MIQRLKEILDQFSSKRVMVIGDYYLDEYFYCKAEKFSPEAPVPRAIVKKVEHVPGCAGNVAISFRCLGAQVIPVGIIGNDEKGHTLKNKLLNHEINTSTIVSDHQRITGAFSRILFSKEGEWVHSVRFDSENEDKISSTSIQKLKEIIQENINKVDLVFVADYDEVGGKGVVSKEILELILFLTKKQHIPIIGISRENLKNFTNFDVIIGNRKEVEELAGTEIASPDQLESSAQNILQKMNLRRIIITNSNKGMSIFYSGSKVEHPSYAKTIVDICGAGDVLSAAYSLTYLIDCNEEERGLIASHAAAVEISKPGTSPVYLQEIISSILSNPKECEKQYTQYSELLLKIIFLRKEGKKIVFTNGYFDLIHSGQIDFLKKAKQLGDILIVGINSNRSTTENKGEGRPFLNEIDRMEILSALSCVDFVTVFDELTPLKVIQTLKPDIVVKGGIYTKEEVIGKDIVESYGGEVKILPLFGRNNTQKLIDKIIGFKK